jgi:hypothetical protein
MHKPTQQVWHNRILRHDELDERFADQVNQYLGPDGNWATLAEGDVYHHVYRNHLIRVNARTDYSTTGNMRAPLADPTIEPGSRAALQRVEYQQRQLDLYTHYTVARAKRLVRWLTALPPPEGLQYPDPAAGFE